MPNPKIASFGGEVRAIVKESGPWWPEKVAPPGNAPNILIVVFDDVGFSDIGCYGSPIKTPTIDRLAAQGLRYTCFHTTAMCSTTRAALLTGRNHHSVGVGCLANFDSGFPGYRGKIAKEAGTLAEMLRRHGYRNYMLGKWHVTPLTEAGYGSIRRPALGPRLRALQTPLPPASTASSPQPYAPIHPAQHYITVTAADFCRGSLRAGVCREPLAPHAAHRILVIAQSSGTFAIQTMTPKISI